jgi:hypothetical protein
MRERVAIIGTLTAVLVALLWLGQASAAEISFIESRDPGGSVTIGFSGGFPYTVGLFSTPESAYVAIYTAGAPRAVGVFGTAETGYVAMVTQGAGAPRTAVAALIEPGTMANPVLSDVLFVTRIPGVVVLEFQSDSAMDPLSRLPSHLVEETGGLDEMYTLTLEGEDIEIKIKAQSNIDGGTAPAQEVPEPGTVLLLGFGLLGVVAVCRRLRRS